MGLNLTALSKLTALKEKQNEQQSQQRTEQPVELPKQKESTSSPTVLAAPSKQNQISVSLANLENLKNSPAKVQQSVDQSGGVSIPGPAEQAKTIKYQEISDSIDSLKAAIHGAHPRMPGLLQEIWKTLQSYPEQVTLLEEDQMEIIIAGLEKVVDTDLANITIKSAVKGGKAGKAAITTDSLGF